MYKLIRHPVLIVGLALSLVAAADAAEPMQRIEITGSAIKRADSEPPVPIEIVTREQIRRSGATTVNELLKSIPVIDINDAGELSAGGQPFASGTARIRLRGLGDAQTLTLIDGRRVPVNPFDDNSGAGAAFNVNQIPIVAIERIEILKDGASAIYGADAVAGVVNFILRKDYRGATVSSTLGQSSRGDGRERRATVAAGIGDFDRDGFHLLASLEAFRRDAYWRDDRDISRSADFRRFGPIPGFNLDARLIFAPEGNLLRIDGTPSGLTLRPCAAENYSGNACRYDFNAAQRSGYNPADRYSAMLAAKLSLDTDTNGFARLLHSRADDRFAGGPVPGTFILPDGRRYAGLFIQGATEGIDRRMTMTHLDIGVEGMAGATEWKLGASSGRAEVNLLFVNPFARADLNRATMGDVLNGVAPTIDTTVTTNDPAVIDALRISPRHDGSNRVDLLDGKLSGTIFDLPAGAARYAIGVNLWKETVINEPDPILVEGGLFGTAARSSIRADRVAQALFAELQLPISRAIETQWAARFDRYEGTSRPSHVSPKAALKWRVAPNWMLRASYAESFKMPTLKQLHATSGQRGINLTESQCTGIGLASGCAGTPANLLTGSNGQLEPERGRSLNLGFVADLDPLSLGVDVWRVDKEDNIATPTIDEAIQQGNFRFDVPLARWVVEQNLQNYARSHHAGIDVDARMRFKTALMGQLTLRAAATYYTRQATRTTPTSTWTEFNATYATPRWRAVLAADAERGAWILSGLLRATSGFWDTTLPHESFSALPPGGLRRVRAHDEIDLALTWRGISSLVLSGAVKNVLDRMPPFSATNAASNGFSQQGFAELYTARGRYFQISAEYSF